MQLLSKAQQRKGDKRSAAANDQGNQKTPTMIQAVLVDALASEEDGVTAPRGGFTDVGLHTGGLPRNTSWPLVRAVMQAVLEDAGHDLLHRHLMAQLKLWLAEMAARTLPRSLPQAMASCREAHQRRIDSCMQMLRAAVLEGATLADEQTHIRAGGHCKHAIDAFEARCVLVRWQLDQAVEQRAAAIASTYELPLLSKAELPCHNPDLSPPELTMPAQGKDGLSEAHQRARKNLDWLPDPLLVQGLDHQQALGNFLRLQQWLDNPRLQPGVSDAAALLALETVERTFFACSSDLETPGCWYSEANEAHSVKLTLTVERIIDQYRLILNAFRSSRSGPALLSVERDSRELLVVWCAFCFVHKATLPFEFKVLQGYGVALRPDDLRHIVLSQKPAIEAAQHVVAYLRKHTKHQLEVFSLRPSDTTFEMARLHSSRSPETQALWKAEKEGAASRQDQHWKTVQEKQAKLRILDQELSSLEEQLSRAERNRDMYHKPRKYTTAANDSSWYEHNTEMASFTRLVDLKQLEIKVTERPPDPIFQPLPEAEAAAGPVMFFLTMPQRFQVLSRLSFTAQQMLLPRSSTVTVPMSDHKIEVNATIEQAPAKTTWRSYYLSSSTARHRSSAVDTKVRLESDVPVPQSSQFSPPNVRTFSAPSIGIWHPDELRPRLTWAGGGFQLDARSSCFDPFAPLPDTVLVHKFTESLSNCLQLPCDKDDMMQWAMLQNGTNSEPSRGNVPEALHGKKCSWLPGKTEVLSCGAMRAYPHQQVRKVCVALRERNLPLDEPAVRKLLQQTLFHLGELSEGEQPRPKWRIDLVEHGGWDALRHELEGLADELKLKPRQHAAVLVLGELAAHASQWDDSSRSVARRFAEIARAWAREDVESAPADKVAHLRSRRCIFAMYVISCNGAGELSQEDVVVICEAVLLAEYSRLFEDPSPLDRTVRELTVVAKEVMARRMPELLAELDRDSAPLTAAVKLVLEAVTPSSLNWTRVKYDGEMTGCFEAVSSDSHLYSVNLLTGVLLFDGLPPSRLPKTILDLPLYQRTFSDPVTSELRNFEVLSSSEGVLTTVRLQGGLKYEFSLNPSGQLVVREVDPSNPKMALELLDGTTGKVETWGQQLPFRLQQMHSHWYCRQVATVVLRPKTFYQRDVRFMMVRHATTDNSGWICYRVPDHHVKHAWLDVRASLDIFDQLVLPDADSIVMRILRKFETEPGTVHIFRDANGVLIFELPRYDLGFKLDEESGKLRSMNFMGFDLAGSQQLHDALSGFDQYLILESRSERLLIIPAGKVTRDANCVFISGPKGCVSDRRLHAYELHPRFLTLEAKAGATAIEARLQLSALFAATGTEVPELRSKQTGGEVALELLRQSWNGGPMNKREQEQLNSIPAYGELTPALPLVCSEVDASARELLSLRPGYEMAEGLSYDKDAATEYTLRKQRALLNSRALLTPEEESRMLGTKVSARRNGAMPSAGGLDVPRHSSTARETERIESELRAMLQKSCKLEEGDSLPLNASDVRDNQLGRAFFDELTQSWSAQQLLPTVKLSEKISQLEKALLVQHGHARSLRDRVELHLIECVDRIPVDAGWHASAFVMRRAANLAPRVTLRDLARASWEPNTLREFNPFLSEAAVKDVLHPAILEWLELCVLEDKLERMARIAANGNAQELERELKEVGRDWAAKQHPQWLVFEVEQRLQIRRVQYLVAQFFIDNPGSTTQLNMGEGKTRVILPMLVLELAHSDRLVRLHFLSQLIDEAYYYLHRHLTASLMGRRLLRLPFHRDVNLTLHDVKVMHDCLTRCMLARGAVLVAPEHRLSLQLKWHELRLSGKTALVNELPSLDQLPYCDLLDESDEILHHKYQLIYAWGHNVLLPAGEERWRAVQTILRLVQTSPRVAELLEDPNVARRLQVERGSGAFDDLRLLPGTALDAVRNELNRALAAALMDNPPYSMRWVRSIAQRDVLISFVTDPKLSLSWLEEELSSDINELQQNQLLALRGLLAIGMLEHCLSRRHRVDYGVDARRKSRRVAVPYRASDTPSERAEYAQPDTLIIFTQLSYYHTGLLREQIKEAVAILLTLGPMAQKAEYNLWLESARLGMSVAQIDALDHVDKLDTTSEVQLSNLHAVYQFNMALIDFWLKTCVLPRETMQFPSRLVANAFNLTDNPKGDIMGFSGTKDNHLLLPFGVSQRTPDGAKELLATDGKMVELILRNKDVACLESKKDVALSSAVMQLVIDRAARALIDAGATMAGLSNTQVAEALCDKLSDNLQGVVYFEPEEASWYVLSRQGRRWPQSSSPLHERDCLVYFDESRCRGADMKLNTDALAVLTIGPGMCKDKLMQAAGRMRKLDRGQLLLFAVPPELVPKIFGEGSEDPSSLLLLKWVMKNTVMATAAGIPEYSKQASHFCMTHDPKARLLDENLQLAGLYGSSVGEDHVDAVVKRTIERDERRCDKLGIAYSDTAKTLSNEITLKAVKYGADLRIVSTGVDEECERELENERELERERELQVPEQKPFNPPMWNFALLLAAASPMPLHSDAGVMPLEVALEVYHDESLSAIPWDRTDIYVTSAFMKTVIDKQGSQLKDLSDFMRPVDAIVIFPSEEVLLLSEWEADHVLPLMWASTPVEDMPFFVNLAYLREAADKQRSSEEIRLRVPALPRSGSRSSSKLGVADITVAGLQLLAGETMFGTAKRKKSVTNLLTNLASSSAAAKKAALQLVALRGKQHMISRSDLELICNSDIGDVE